MSPLYSNIGVPIASPWMAGEGDAGLSTGKHPGTLKAPGIGLTEDTVMSFCEPQKEPAAL